MEENNESLKDIDLWATNSEEGGWNISSTDEGSQKMLEQEDDINTKIKALLAKTAFIFLFKI